jgi:hypothetical protein
MGGITAHRGIYKTPPGVPPVAKRSIRLETQIARRAGETGGLGAGESLPLVFSIIRDMLSMARALLIQRQ